MTLNKNVKNTIEELKQEQAQSPHASSESSLSSEVAQKCGIKTDDKKKVSSKESQIYSKRLRDGRTVEAYYDREKEETGLLVFEKSNTLKMQRILIDNQVYTAPPPTNRLIQGGFVLLPSESLEFTSEKSLIQEVKSFIHDYVQIPMEFEDLASFYVVFSWVYDEFQELPYLRAIGDYGSGKSRFLKVMGALCYRPIFLNGSASASAMFRMIDEIKGTIILDEADFKFSDTTNEIVKILNTGFQKGIPVFRSEAVGKNMKAYDPTPFNVFGPKIIATRKDFSDDALESRCLTNAMETLSRDDIPENLEDDFEIRALQIRNKLVSFRFRKLSSGISKEQLPKLQIEPRLKQIIFPLYRVINDPDCKRIILNFIHNKQQEELERRFNSFEGELLQAILKALESESEPTMKDITKIYNEDFGDRYPIKAKKTGSVVEKILHLQKKKSAHGICLCSTQENEERLKALKVKFGICKANVNIVNEMNNTPNEPITPEQVVEIFGGGEIIDCSNN